MKTSKNVIDLDEKVITQDEAIKLLKDQYGFDCDIEELLESAVYDESSDIADVCFTVSSDIIHQIADSRVDVYNYTLRKWLVDNYDYLEMAVNEGFVDTSNFDLHKACMAGQFLQNQEEMYETLDSIPQVKIN